MTIRRDILECIGGTPLVALRSVTPRSGARVLIKIESENPTGSMKDRMALAMIAAAEANGRLAPGQPVVEYTTGSTGASLALVCGVRGHRLHVVTSDAFAPEKRDHIALLGATLHIVPSDGGRMTEKLTRDMIDAARQIAEQTGAYWTDQLRNRDQTGGYDALGRELWEQSDAAIDAFVQSVGTGGSLRGTSEALRRFNSGVQVFAVEPAESAVLSGGRKGAHGIDGMGAGFVVPLWQPDLVSGIERVLTSDAMAMAARLAREEGIFGGPSTGANVVAALRVAERLGPGATIATVMCDSGAKYLSKFRQV